MTTPQARFLFAASRGDTLTIALMCNQGFDPNGADYDNCTALMVAAMKGNTEAVMKILEYKANPNMVDVYGSSALYEAARNGHKEATMNKLLDHNADLCMIESLAASTLCQAIFNGDILTLRHLLKAKIVVNSSDYISVVQLFISPYQPRAMLLPSRSLLNLVPI
jgi:ankyrin repeat protein